MSNNSKIIQPGIIHPESRSNRRMSLIEANKRLVDMNRRQAENINSMNAFLTDLAVTVGTEVPKSAQDGISAVDALRERVVELVEMERRCLCLTGSSE